MFFSLSGAVWKSLYLRQMIFFLIVHTPREEDLLHFNVSIPVDSI
jgi:hypothetical protein